MQSKYYVLYRVGCVVNWKEFSHYANLQRWSMQFLLENQDNMEDNGIDAILKGSMQFRISDVGFEACETFKPVAEELVTGKTVSDEEFKDKLVEAIEETGKQRESYFERVAKKLEESLNDGEDVEDGNHGGFDGTHFP